MPRALLILLIAIVAIISNSKKKKQAQSGQSAAQPVRNRPWPQEKAVEASTVQEIKAPQPPQSAQPNRADESRDAPEEPEQPQVHVTLKTLEQEKKAPGFGQGASRECEHGVVGGSIAGDAHEGEEKHAVRRAPETRPVELDAPLRPRMDARELRRAVVLSEILKRPGERGRRF